MNYSFIKAATISSVLVTVTACGSSQAPWSKPDDSPWDKEHTHAASSSDDRLVVESTPPPIEHAPIESVSIQQPGAAEPSRFVDEPDIDAPAPEAVEAEVIVEEMSVTDRVMAMPAGSYAVQVYASSTDASVAKYQANNDLNELVALKTERGGVVYHVLVDLHDDRASADAAAAQLEQKLGSKTWVRSVAGLQDILVK